MYFPPLILCVESRVVPLHHNWSLHQLYPPILLLQQNIQSIISQSAMMAGSEVTIGRLQMHWKGTYSASNIPTADSMQYHVVTTKEIGEDKAEALCHSAIPTTWFDSSGKYFVHPPKTFVVCKKTPIDWPNLTFYRHSSPCMSWLEYDVSQIETAGCPRDHKGAFRILKQIRDNIGKEMWSDPERPLGTGKRKKTMTDKVAQILKKRKKSSLTKNDLEPIKEHQQLGNDLARPVETAAVQNTTNDPETIKEHHHLGDGFGHAETAAAKNNFTQEQQEQSRPVQSIETGGFWEDTPTPLNNNVAVNIPAEVVEKEISNQDQRTFQDISTPTPAPRNNNVAVNIPAEVVEKELPSQDQRTFQDISTPKLPPNSTGRDQVKRVLTDQQSWSFDKVNNDFPEDGSVPLKDQPSNLIHTIEPEPVPASSTSTTPHHGNHFSEAVDSYYSLEERVKSLEKGNIDKDEMIRIFKDGIRQVLAAVENQGNKQKKVMTAAAYHKACVEKHFSTLPCTDVEKIVAFNTALLDDNLSVSLACSVAIEFRWCKSHQDFVTNVFVRLISARLCSGLQWKAGGRGTDKRQGLSCFVNIISVMGVALCIFMRAKNEMERLPLQTLIYLVQKARKLGAKKETDVTATPVPAVVTETEKFHSEIEARIELLMLAVDKFEPPKARNTFNVI